MLSSFNKLFRNVVFSDRLIASGQENNLQGNKITNVAKATPVDGIFFCDENEYTVLDKKVVV